MIKMFPYRAEMSRRLEALLAKDPKNRLHSNLRNISVQLDALGDLHDNLEREMKQSALVSCLLPLLNILIVV